MGIGTALILIGVIIIGSIIGATFWHFFWLEARRAAKAEFESIIVRTDRKPGTIVWLMRSYLPNVKAGSEITAHALNRYLLTRGWRIIVVLPDWRQWDVDGVKCIKFDPDSRAVADAFMAADVIFCQNYDTIKSFNVLEPFKKPIVYFLHLEKEKRDILQTRFSVPVGIVFNSLSQKEVNPTIHENTIVRPFIDFDKFMPRSRSITDGSVVLLNCNKNKGGELLIQLAKQMPDVKFLGVRGAYQKQLEDKLPNLDYLPLQDDPRRIYEGAGIVIMPSKSESWGRVALEAMASGVPVIVSKSPGLRECTSNAAANYCAYDDVACFGSAIRKLRSDPIAYKSAIAAGLQRIDVLKKETDFEDFDKWIRDRIVTWKATAHAFDETFKNAQPPPGWDSP
jgi:glycosyltransferase involved in cell wall biosynthesis